MNIEPFHTTKPDGLGMGLSICRSIAQDHDGTVELTNRSGTPGAVFRLTLPLAPSETRHAA
jgi:two-component system sensor histidine kinase TtrS